MVNDSFLFHNAKGIMKVKPWVGEAITIKHSRMLDFLLNVDGPRTINLFNLTFGSGQKS